jgi:hypothetical protein
MRIIAFITDAPTVCDILAHLGELTAPPRIAPARGPPLWEAADARTGDFDPTPSRHRVRVRSTPRSRGRRSEAFVSRELGRHAPLGFGSMGHESCALVEPW